MTPRSSFLRSWAAVERGDLKGFGSRDAGLDFEFRLAMEIETCGVVGAAVDGDPGIAEALGHGEHGRVGVLRGLAIVGGCGVAADRQAALGCAALDLGREPVEVRGILADRGEALPGVGVSLTLLARKLRKTKWMCWSPASAVTNRRAETPLGSCPLRRRPGKALTMPGTRSGSSMPLVRMAGVAQGRFPARARPGPGNVRRRSSGQIGRRSAWRRVS